MIGTFRMYSPPWFQYEYYNSKVVSKLNAKNVKVLKENSLKSNFLGNSMF